MSISENIEISVKLLTGDLILFSVPKNEHQPPYRYLQRLVADEMKSNIESIRLRPMRERREKGQKKPFATNFVAIVDPRPQIVLHIPYKLKDCFRIDFHHLKHPTVIQWCNMDNTIDIHNTNTQNTYEQYASSSDEDQINIYIEYMCKKMIENKYQKIEGKANFLSNPHPRAVRWILANLDNLWPDLRNNGAIFENTNESFVNELMTRIKNDFSFYYPYLSNCKDSRLVDLLIQWFRDQPEKKLLFYDYDDHRIKLLERGCQGNERLAQYVLTHPLLSQKMSIYQKLGIVARWPEMNINIVT